MIATEQDIKGLLTDRCKQLKAQMDHGILKASLKRYKSCEVILKWLHFHKKPTLDGLARFVITNINHIQNIIPGKESYFKIVRNNLQELVTWANQRVVELEKADHGRA